MSKVIVKLGGSVLYDSHSIQNALNRIREIEPDMIVVSAFKNQTNLLEELYSLAKKGDKSSFHSRKMRFFDWYKELAKSLKIPMVDRENPNNLLLNEENEKITNMEECQMITGAEFQTWGAVLDIIFLFYLFMRKQVR